MKYISYMLVEATKLPRTTSLASVDTLPSCGNTSVSRGDCLAYKQPGCMKLWGAGACVQIRIQRVDDCTTSLVTSLLGCRQHGIRHGMPRAAFHCRRNRQQVCLAGPICRTSSKSSQSQRQHRQDCCNCIPCRNQEAGRHTAFQRQGLHGEGAP